MLEPNNLLKLHFKVTNGTLSLKLLEIVFGKYFK